jgi:hypothetical protein
VGTNLAIFADPPRRQLNLVIYSDFFAGDPGPFRLQPGDEERSGGIDPERSSSELCMPGDLPMGPSGRYSRQYVLEPAGGCPVILMAPWRRVQP